MLVRTSIITDDDQKAAAATTACCFSNSNTEVIVPDLTVESAPWSAPPDPGLVETSVDPDSPEAQRAAVQSSSPTSSSSLLPLQSSSFSSEVSSGEEDMVRVFHLPPMAATATATATAAETATAAAPSSVASSSSLSGRPPIEANSGFQNGLRVSVEGRNADTKSHTYVSQYSTYAASTRKL